MTTSSAGPGCGPASSPAVGAVLKTVGYRMLLEFLNKRVNKHGYFNAACGV